MKYIVEWVMILDFFSNFSKNSGICAFVTTNTDLVVFSVFRYSTILSNLGYIVGSPLNEIAK